MALQIKLQFTELTHSPKMALQIKGTVGPDRISLRVLSLDRPLKGHQPLYVFDFLILILNIWEEFKVLSRFMQKKSNLLLIRITVCIKYFIWWKSPQKCCSILVWIADCWFSSNILLTSRNPKNNCWLSRIFGARFGGKDRGLWPYNPWSQQGGWLIYEYVPLELISSVCTVTTIHLQN